MGRPATRFKSSGPPKGSGPGRVTRRDFRFPCGHVEDGASLDRRMRTTDRAAWVRCHTCNVIGLLVASRDGRPSRAHLSRRTHVYTLGRGSPAVPAGSF